MVPWNKPSSETEVVELQNGKIDNANDEKKVVDSVESKETFVLELGTYKATVVPLMVLFFGFVCGTTAVAPMKPDPRVGKWFLMQSSLVVLVICILYVLFSIVWGPNFMKNRLPYKMKKTMIVYNAFQVVLSTYMFFEVGLAGWFFDYSFGCQACDYSTASKPMRIASVAWLFFISKIIDFIDTLFSILNKKNANISTLHVVHHSCMCMSMYFGIRYTPGGSITFMGYLNSGVHAIMYSYYFLASFGPAMQPYLWWKRYLTRIQLTQFIAIFFHAVQNLILDCPNVPIGLPIWTCVYTFIFFSLFMDFYYRAYLHNDKIRKTAKKKMEANVNNSKTISNGCPPPIENGYKTSHMRTPSNLTSFRLDTCLRERQPTSKE